MKEETYTHTVWTVGFAAGNPFDHISSHERCLKTNRDRAPGSPEREKKKETEAKEVDSERWGATPMPKGQSRGALGRHTGHRERERKASPRSAGNSRHSAGCVH